MQYIKKIILENFQSHKYSEIELDPYLNVIVGPSDQGKSAIIRALKWALFNEPAGDFFIREGENECSVTVIFSDDIKVKRFRSRSKNAYYLYDASGEEIAFEGFGTSVPQEVRDMISIRKVELDSNVSNLINISEQLEGPFLLSEKNSTKANSIGRIVGVHIVDDALKDTLKDIRNLKAKRKNHKNVLEGLQENLRKYDYLDNLIERLGKLKDIKQDIHDKENRLDRLSKLFINLNEIKKDIISTNKDLKELSNIYKIVEIEDRLKKDIQHFNYMGHKLTTLTNIKSQIKDDNELLYCLSELDEAGEVSRRIEALYIKLNKLDTLNVKYKDVVDKIDKHNDMLLQLKNIHYVDKKAKLIEEYLSMLTKLLNLKGKWDQTNKSLSIGKVYVEELSKIDTVSDIQNLLDSKINLLNQLIDYRNRYRRIRTNRKQLENNLKDINIHLDRLLVRYESILTKIEICPICFGSIDRLKIDEIVNSYR